MPRTKKSAEPPPPPAPGEWLIQKRHRDWLVIDPAGQLVCITVYKRGACVFWIHRDPDIQITCRARKAVVDDGVAANQQILNAMGAEQAQELFEVAR